MAGSIVKDLTDADWHNLFAGTMTANRVSYLGLDVIGLVAQVGPDRFVFDFERSHPSTLLQWLEYHDAPAWCAERVKAHFAARVLERL